MKAQALTEARAMFADLQACTTLVELDQLYFNWIGYSVIEDDPAATFTSVQTVLKDYIKEFCYSTGVHCSLVSPDFDSFGGQS